MSLAESATQKVFIDRSRVLDYERCKRLRYLGYHAGSANRGLQPIRKSIHLIIGGAVHAGMEVLLREGQRELYHIAKHMCGPDAAIGEHLKVLFETSVVDAKAGITFARNIEDMAVVSALADLAAATAHGVELDDLEKFETAKAATEATEATKQTANLGGSSEPMIEISFEGLVPANTKALDDGPFEIKTNIISPEDFAQASLTAQLKASLAIEDANQTSTLDWSTPVYIEDTRKAAQAQQTAKDSQAALLDTIIVNQQANEDRATGVDDYLREELAAQVEAMVRAYARRRWRPLLEQFEVLEVEREGEWKLGEIPLIAKHKWSANVNSATYCASCGEGMTRQNENQECQEASLELWFMSRHDALLRERTTGYLYLQSYKTTGSWDRRRAADAEVDMQGLSEAVDVEKRLGEAWQLFAKERHGEVEFSEINDRLVELVNDKTAQWLSTLPEPPRILGVRYEYLIKGQRRKDKDAGDGSRYVADTPLIRAYKTDGLTADDRRWAHSYKTWTQIGTSSQLNYRSWKKAPVWKFMTIAQWIDMLDRGEIQPDAYDANGYALDILADQFIEPIHVYRNEDDMRDMLEQLEAAETQIAIDVAAVAAVKSDPARYRSELNRRFPQSRKSCSYPGMCAMQPVCFGAAHVRLDPENSTELYQIRQVNHPQELAAAEVII